MIVGVMAGHAGSPLPTSTAPHTPEIWMPLRSTASPSWEREEREQRAERRKQRVQLHKAPKEESEEDGNGGRAETKADREGQGGRG